MVATVNKGNVSQSDEYINALSKLEAFACEKLDVTQNIKFVFHNVENDVEEEEMLFTSIFSSFRNVFKTFFFFVLKSNFSFFITRHWQIGAYSFWSVRLFVRKTFTLAIAFER